MKDASAILPITAHGWQLHRITMPAGGKYGVIVPTTTERTDFKIASLHTKGRIVGRNVRTGEPTIPREVGTVTTELPPVPAGRFEYTVDQDAEWYCIDAQYNGGQIPQIGRTFLEAGQAISGVPLLVCSGKDEGLSDTSYTATDSCYVMTFDRSKA